MLVSEACTERVDSAAGNVEFEEAGPVLMKGIPEPVSIYRAVANAFPLAPGCSGRYVDVAGVTNRLPTDARPPRGLRLRLANQKPSDQLSSLADLKF